MTVKMASAVQEAETFEDFQDWVKRSKEQDRLLVIDFTATWCGPCKMIAPKFAEFSLAEEFQVPLPSAESASKKETRLPLVNFLKIDVDKNDEAAAKCGIRSMPTFQFWRDGKCVNTVNGADPNNLLAQLRWHRYGVIPDAVGGNAAGGYHPLSGGALRQGVLVTVRGLASEGGKKMNGHVGEVRGWDAEKRRYNVLVTPTPSAAGVEVAEVGDLKEPKEAALQIDNFVQRVSVEVLPGEGKDETSRFGTVVEAEVAESKELSYKIRFEGAPSTESIPAANCVVPNHTRGVVVGLKAESAKKHNGKWCRILAYSPESGRYTVAVGAMDQLLRLRRDCVWLVDAPHERIANAADGGANGTSDEKIKVNMQRMGDVSMEKNRCGGSAHSGDEFQRPK